MLRQVIRMFGLCVLCSLTSLAVPALGHAGSFLMTGFVPELATPTAEVHFGYLLDSIRGYDLDKVTLGGRFSYVFMPKLELLGSLDVITYDFKHPVRDTYPPRDKSLKETGIGVEVGAKYQVPAVLEDFDMAVAGTISLGKSSNFSEYFINILALISRDIARGWTPYAGAGLSMNRQEFDGTASIAPEEENRFDVPIFAGVKYMIDNTIGAQTDVYFLNGFGLEASVSYRF